MQGNCQSQVLPATGLCRDLVLDSVVVDDCLLMDFQLRLLRTRCVRPSSVSHPTSQPPAHHSCSLSSIHPARHSGPLISPSACPCVLTIPSVPLQKWRFSFTTYACAKFMSQYSPPQFSWHQCVRLSALSQAVSHFLFPPCPEPTSWCHCTSPSLAGHASCGQLLIGPFIEHTLSNSLLKWKRGNAMNAPTVSTAYVILPARMHPTPFIL